LVGLVSRGCCDAAGDSSAGVAVALQWCICNNGDMVNAAVDEIVSNCLAVRVRMLGRTVTSLYDHALEEHGVSIAQVNLMAALGKMGPCSPARIGEVLQLERSTVSRNLSLLMKHGLVEAVSANAKGVREVALTSSGRKKIEAVMWPFYTPDNDVKAQ